jgi:8-oxo-dGTP pyrophosphatase MutT (NUDIX family)
METESIPYFEDEKSKLIPGQPVVEREAINAIIRNPKTNEFLCLLWPEFDWKTFIIGGIEKDEDAVIAAQREITEETGYFNLKFIAQIGQTRSGYYAAHKKENRISNAVGLLFELINDEQQETSQKETKHHHYKWLPKEEVAGFVNLLSQKYIWKKTLEYLN